MDGLVRTRKETDRARRTHILETAEGETCQDTERDRPTEAHSRTKRRQREELVRTRKDTDQPMCTHSLEMAEEGACQDTERNRPTEVHSHTGDGRGMDLSGHGRKPTDRGTLTAWKWQREGLVRIRKETDRSRCTHELETAEGGTCQVTQRNRPARCTHILEMAQGGTCQDMKRNGSTEAHSLPEDSKWGDLSEH